MSVNRSYQYEYYRRGQRPRVSESYLHLQRVQSRFRKHASVMQYAVHVVVLLAILFGLAQAVRTIAYDVYKLSILTGNHAQIGGFYQDTLAENQALNEKIAIYSSPAGIEELARNNLEMVGPGEILVRLHQ